MNISQDMFDIDARKKVFASFVVAVLLFVLGYKLDIEGLINERKLLQGLLTEKKRPVQNEFTKKEQDFAVAIDRSVSLDELEIFDILRALEEVAIKESIEIVLFEPKVLPQGRVINLDLKSNYEKQLKFLDSLIQKDFLIKVEKIELKKEGSTGSNILLSNLSLVFYKNSLQQNLSAKKIAIDIPKRDIFAWPENKNYLYIWSIKELRFAGIIKHGKKIVGVVVDPTGRSHQVVVGDKIGLDQSKIIEINQKEIVTANRDKIV